MRINIDTKRGKIYKSFVFSMITVSSISLGMFWIWNTWNKVPSDINVRIGMEEGLDLMVPATATIYKKEEDEEVNITLSKEIRIYGKEENTYTMKVNLFGFIPFKESSVSVIQDTKLIPGGIPIGIFVETDGILVIDIGSFSDIRGNKVEPAKDFLKPGDYIHTVNGEKINDKKQLMDVIANSEGKELSLEITRNDKNFTIHLLPRKNESGEYKLGIWVRDNAQGIGTLTFTDEEGNFGALGHGINDIDTADLMTLKKGGLYRTDIVSITKGLGGSPGELTGVIAYSEKYRMGDIYQNSVEGIYGKMDSKNLDFTKEALPIALKQEIKKGKAQIVSYVSGKKELYDIEITEIHLSNDNVNRGLEIVVTDERLLDMTGGIVQGMSGSPIIQDGKIVGAVTHVLINDPTRGYGIFIENMLEH